MTMTVGLAAVSGTVLVLYASVIEPVVPGALGQILVVPLRSSRCLRPSSSRASWCRRTLRHADGHRRRRSFLEYQSSMDAVTRGTFEGWVQLHLNIIAMLVVMVALVALVNILLARTRPGVRRSRFSACSAGSFRRSSGRWACRPARCMSPDNSWAPRRSSTNSLPISIWPVCPRAHCRERSTLMVYALCGFANFGSVGILIGGLTALVPSRRADIVTLGTRAIVSGTLATSMTGAVVGLIT